MGNRGGNLLAGKLYKRERFLLFFDLHHPFLLSVTIHANFFNQAGSCSKSSSNCSLSLKYNVSVIHETIPLHPPSISYCLALPCLWKYLYYIHRTDLIQSTHRPSTIHLPVYNSVTQTLHTIPDMSSSQAPLESEPPAKPQLKCQQWMSDLSKNLSAKAEAHDRYNNTIKTKIIGEHTGRIQPTLREKLSQKTCTLARLVENRPGMHRRTVAYMERAIKVRKNTLATISEVHKLNTGVPKMPRLSEKKKLASWIKESLEIYGKYIASDLVDASIKPRLKKVRQCLWSYRKTGKGVGMVIAEGRSIPSRSDLQCLNTEVAVMLAITMKMAKYKQLLDGSHVDPGFRPRVVRILGILKSYQENHFRTKLDITALSQFEMEIQNHLKSRAHGESLLVSASES